jgi:DNA-binding MarR family transcriptional regulator
MPRNGMYLVSGLARTTTPLEALIKQLAVSKQAAGQLVDTLVAQDYITRVPDEIDRRRMNIILTERGKLAASASRSAVDKVEADLLHDVGETHLRNTRTTLIALIDMNDKRHNLPRDAR